MRNIKYFENFFNSKLNKLLLFSLFSIVLFIFSYNNGLFWDNVLFVSKMGNHLYSNPFNWILPNDLDPGHPPTLGFLTALSWKIFGHKIWVSHLIMIPFTCGLFFQINKLISYYIKSNIASFLGLILIFSDPTLSVQLLIINPEIIQLFFFFLAINSILYKNYYLKIIALFFLSIVSLRSMMLCGGVFLFEFLNDLILEKKRIKTFFNSKFIISYIIGSIPGILFISIHFIQKGWIISHPNSPWESHHHLVTFNEFIRNLLILIHRFSDFGRIFVLIFLLFSLLKFKKKLFNKKNKQLFLLAISSVIIVVLASLLKTNPIGHRYFIAAYIILTLLTFVILMDFVKNKKIIYSLLLVGLISGNLWIYPRNISQGWDASLAHIPYYGLRNEAINYLDENNIQIEKVATFFPNCTKIDDIDFSGDLRSFSSFNGSHEYIFYSNVYNLTDEEYETIDSKYTLIKQFKKFNIHVIIYKLKKL